MMKRVLSIMLMAVVSAIALAQTMNIQVGNVITAVPAAQAGDVVYSDNGQTLTVLGKAFTVSDITQIYIDNASVTDNTVSVVYSGTSATVTIAGNIAQYLTATVSGAHVSIVQGEGIGDTTGKVEYTLSGTSADGEFYLEGSYKMDLELDGLTLTNPSGPAIYINNGKKINVTLKKDTESTLADGTGGDWKGCFRVKGHTELKGKGTLNIYGNSVNAFWGKEYLEMKNCTLNILKAVKDGVNVNQHFLMSSGTLNISGVGDDGVQVSYKTDDNDDIIPLTEDEDNTGQINITGGTVNISVTAEGAKGLKAEGDINIDESSATVSITVNNSGGVDATDSSDPTSSACIKTDANMTISGGTLTLSNTGQGGRGILTDGTLTVSGGTLAVSATGSTYGSSSGGGGWHAPGQGGGALGGPGGGPGGKSSNGNSPKGIKAKGALAITGGDICAVSTNHEAIESKSTIDISSGNVYAQAGDDAINASSNMTISGGYVCGYSTNNDGLDANGNMYIKGGVVYAIGSSAPEVALDANTEGGYKLYVTGGTIVAIGSLESGSSLTQSCYQSSSWSKNTWYSLTNGDFTLAFKTPSSGGSKLVVSTSSQPTVKSGVTVTDGTGIFSGMGMVDATVTGGSSVSLSSYTSGGGWWW